MHPPSDDGRGGDRRFAVQEAHVLRSSRRSSRRRSRAGCWTPIRSSGHARTPRVEDRRASRGSVRPSRLELESRPTSRVAVGDIDEMAGMTSLPRSGGGAHFSSSSRGRQFHDGSPPAESPWRPLRAAPRWISNDGDTDLLSAHAGTIDPARQRWRHPARRRDRVAGDSPLSHPSGRPRRRRLAGRPRPQYAASRIENIWSAPAGWPHRSIPGRTRPRCGCRGDRPPGPGR